MIIMMQGMQAALSHEGRKSQTPDDAVEWAVKQKVLFIVYCLHCAMPTDTLLPRRLWDEPPIGLNTKCVST